AQLNLDQVPAGPVLQTHTLSLRRQFTLSGGDDYELCFTAPGENRDAVIAAAQHCLTPVTRVGRIVAAPGLQLLDAQGQTIKMTLNSFDHFTTP
ncbi:MAG: thiamine-phosphate kinase, partial [Burkholderiales bacterium]|nr:thiamine-phosphate kinase [Burkholderiales bacterium]